MTLKTWDEVQGKTIQDAFKDLRGCAIGHSQKYAHVTHALSRKWPEHPWVKPHDGVLIICGGGPSMKDRGTLDKIRRLAGRSKHFVLTTNGTHDHFNRLPEKRLGPVIHSEFAVLLDPKTRVKDYISPRNGTAYFIASQCDPHTLDVFEGFKKFLYHHEDDTLAGLLDRLSLIHI